MTEISFLTGELLLAGIWIAVRAGLGIARGRTDRKREALLLLMYVNLAVLLRFTFYPMSRVNGKIQPLRFDAGAVWPPKVNLLPLVHLTAYDTGRDLLLNLIGNFTMFIPSGILFPVLFPRLRSFGKTVAAGAALSLCIELMQLLFFDRTTDIDDLLLNTAGCAAGYLIYAGLRQLCKKKRRYPDSRADRKEHETLT